MNKIKMFLKFKGFRSLLFAFIRAKIDSFISIPMDVIDEIKMIKEIPDPWDRYVRRREKYNQRIEKAKRVERSTIWSLSLESVVHMNIDAMVFLESEGVRDYVEERVRRDFEEHKINLLECMNLLKNEGIHVPDHLMEKIKNYNIDDFNNLQEADEFGRELLEEAGAIKVH